MGRWTPLILMAGGLAILLGTLIGTWFPMNGQNAQAPRQNSNRASSVLPANINVNSTATGSSPNSENRDKVAQNETTIDNSTNVDQSQSTNSSGSTTTDSGNSSGSTSTGSGSNDSPIRALW
ncbi:hypothetical protein [Calothrix sp. UHCC 0171]|uniref:hypothetical protein n=1 Tax=Calothrix sp. UHCC 0171 TaxID=3110245 RepID=UPI002B1F7E56|nr:hypothetical protein [Calothrix sp. UHCC 0171]MEA5573821.1 hypothetical protein [Calothrix sp. UHCC 0171]